MRTKDIIIAIVTAGAIVFGVGSAAFAAGPGKKHHKGKRFDVDKRVEKMAERLELDDAQADKIRVILKRSKADMKALKAADGDRSEKRKEFRAIKESARAEIDAVLTPEQLAKAEAFRAEAKEKRKERRKRKGAHKMERMKKRLDLTDAQAVQIKEIRTEARQEMKSIVQDEFGGDRKAAHDAVKARRAQMVTDMEAVLTPEQVEKFAELREKRKSKRGKRDRSK